MAPSSASSPRNALRSGTRPPDSASEMATAIARSSPLPVFRISAGARFTVSRFPGNAKPLFLIADRTRSRASLTEVAASPTRKNFVSPLALSAWTSTRRASRPASTQESTVASTHRRYRDRCAMTAQAVKTPFPHVLIQTRGCEARDTHVWLKTSLKGSGQAGFGAPAAAFFQVTSRHVRLVAQQQQPPMLLGFVKEARLLLEHPQRLDVRRHRPRHSQVWCLANEVSGHRARKLARAQHDDLAARRVPADVAHVDARKNFRVTVQKLHQVVAVGQRREVIGHVSRLGAHVGSKRKVPLAPLDEVPSLRKRELEAAAIQPRQPAGMIPMQVRRDDGIHLIRTDAHAPQ